jgi:hypothetical protein
MIANLMAIAAKYTGKSSRSKNIATATLVGASVVSATKFFARISHQNGKVLQSPAAAAV